MRKALLLVLVATGLLMAVAVLAMAAVDPAVIGSFFVGDTLMLNVQLAIPEGAELARMNTAELEQRGNVAVLAHTSATTDTRQFHPSNAIPIRPGDTLVVSTVPDYLCQLHVMNSGDSSNLA